MLVRREELLQYIRKKLADALHGRGVPIVVKDASGTGRSRFLDVCILEGNLNFDFDNLLRASIRSVGENTVIKNRKAILPLSCELSWVGDGFVLFGRPVRE